MSQRAVSRILSAFARLAASVGVTTIPLVPSSLTGSSDLPGDSADGPSAPDREVPIRWPPYLVLLRAGFCLPPVLPRARCALTAPFHPYPERGRYIFCATVLQVTLTGRYPAHCPAEFGLSSPPSRSASASARQA